MKRRQAPAPVAARDELVAWLERIGRGVELVDLEVRAADRTVYVARWRPELDRAATMAAEIRAAASAHGELAAGPVLYELDASTEGGDELGTIPLRVDGPHASGPTATGTGADLLATAHRHLESQSALNMRLLSASADAIRAVAEQARLRAAEDAEELRWHREQARAVRLEREAVMRETIAAEVSRDVDAERERRTSALLEQAAGAVLPVLARRLAPAPLTSSSTSSSSSSSSSSADPIAEVRRAWGHLSPETVERIVDELPADVALALAAAMRAGDGSPGAPSEPH